MPDVGDRLKLAPSVELTAAGIVDHVTGVTYPANASAAALLEHGGSLGEISSQLARHWAVDEATVRDDVLRFAWTVNQHALANVQSSAPRAKRVLHALRLAARLAPLGRVPGGIVRRHRIETRTSAAIVGTAIRTLYLRALGYALAVAVVLASSATLVGAGAGGSSATASRQTAVQIGTAALATAVAFLLHEVGHLLGLRGSEAALVLRRGRTSVIHPPLARWHEALVALAGPGAATLTGVAIAIVAYVESDATVAIAASPFCGHAASATVAARDGRLAIGLRGEPRGSHLNDHSGGPVPAGTPHRPRGKE